MFGLCRNVSSTKLARQIFQKRAESIVVQRSGDTQRLAELTAEIDALEQHMLAMRESGLA